MALIIPPLLTIQFQMGVICRQWKIPYLDLSEISEPESISMRLSERKPKVILSSIEDISREDIQKHLQTLNISYVAVDECQVCFLMTTI